MIETAVLLEYSIKKDVSKVLVEQEKFLHVRAFDSNDRKEVEDGAAEEYMRANQMEPVEVAVYDVIFLYLQTAQRHQQCYELVQVIRY
ncbi:MAG: hypothetical protein ACTH6O_05785 [Vibrio toranzoniae]